ncbi:hypothetical protein D3C80_1927640 [compost metagenome]
MKASTESEGIGITDTARAPEDEAASSTVGLARRVLLIAGAPRSEPPHSFG